MDAALTYTLGQLHQLLLPLTEDWMLIGTTSLLVLGYPVEPHDIDILCSAPAAAAIENILVAYQLPADPQLSRHKFRSAFSRYRLNGIIIEVMGDLEVNTPAGWINLRSTIHWPGPVIFGQHTYLVPGRADQQNIYRLFNRAKDQPLLQLLEKQ